MIYTQEQINEIKRRIAALGVKDTDIEELDLARNTITGSETVVIVKDSKNVRVPIGSLIPVTMLEDVRLITDSEDEPSLQFIFKTSEGNKIISVKLGALLLGVGGRIEELENTVNNLTSKEAQDIATIQDTLKNHKNQITTLNSLVQLIRNSEIPALKNRCDTLERKIQTLEYLINNSESTVITNNEESLQTLKEAVDSYLRNVHYDISSNNYSDINRYVGGYYQKLDIPLPVKIPCSGMSLTLYDLYFKQAARLSKTFPINDLEELEIYNLIPNTRYFYSIDYGAQKSFVVNGLRRLIKAGNLKNIRDLGGISTEDGGSIAYDKIFRGCELDGATFTADADAITALNDLGIDTVIDLRNSTEAPNDSTPLDATYLRVPFIRFEELADLTVEKANAIKTAFDAVANAVIAGKKVYFHCTWGYHRAGFLATLIESVLGVKQCEIDKDYELSSFSKINGENVKRTDNNYKTGIEVINTQYGGYWKNLLLACGVEESLIKQFKNAMVIDGNTRADEIGQYYEVTYSQLVNLRNNCALIPGAKYRMIDYDTYDGTEVELASCSGIADFPEFKSKYKHFDLLLTALSYDTLDCNAKALHSARDTEGYFTNRDLAKWELKYDLNNNTSKYNWALNKDIEVGDNTIHIEGRGVIYYMKDEFNNELPYDFKNIMFKYDDNWVSTFSRYKKVTDDGIVKVLDMYNTALDYIDSIPHTKEGDKITYHITPDLQISNVILTFDKDVSYKCDISGSSTAPNISIINLGGSETDIPISNTTITRYLKTGDSIFASNYLDMDIEVYITESLVNENAGSVNTVVKPYISNRVQALNNNLFIISEQNQVISNNFLDDNAHNNILKGDVINCRIGKYCQDNTLTSAEDCVLGNNCINIRVDRADNLYIGNNCYNIAITRDEASKYIKIDDFVKTVIIGQETTNEYLHYVNVNTTELPSE